MTNFIPVYSSDPSPVPKPAQPQPAKPPVSLLQGVIEGLPDGILILTKEAGIVSSNRQARDICRQLSDPQCPVNEVPPDIWRVCIPLLDDDCLSLSQPVQVEGTVSVIDSALIRVRARWLRPEDPERILVMLEDRHQAARQRAMVEGLRCGFTPREAEVFLYRCIDCTYEEIARKLHITVNTVKKHIKSINMKRDACLPDMSA